MHPNNAVSAMRNAMIMFMYAAASTVLNIALIGYILVTKFS
jgi:hypothetical protein